MEINKKQIDILINELGVKKINEIFPKLNILKYNDDKIYVFKGIKDVFKLQCLDHSSRVFAFISLNRSACFANGTGTAEEQIEINKEGLKVFDNYSDFIKYLQTTIQ